MTKSTKLPYPTTVSDWIKWHKRELRVFGVVSSTGNRVVIRFAGVIEEFWFRYGQEPERTPNGITLETHDERVLSELARRANAASIAGYNPSSGRKKRASVEPEPIVNRLKSRSTEKVTLARQSMLYQICTAWLDGDDTFELSSISGQNVVMSFQGMVQRVSWDKSKGSMWCDSKLWISPQWFSFIRMFGRHLSDAALAGYKSTQLPAKQKRHRPSPFQDMRQMQMRL